MTKWIWACGFAGFVLGLFIFLYPKDRTPAKQTAPVKRAIETQVVEKPNRETAPADVPVNDNAKKNVVPDEMFAHLPSQKEHTAPQKKAILATSELIASQAKKPSIRPTPSKATVNDEPPPNKLVNATWGGIKKNLFAEPTWTRLAIVENDPTNEIRVLGQDDVPKWGPNDVEPTWTRRNVIGTRIVGNADVPYWGPKTPREEGTINFIFHQGPLATSHPSGLASSKTINGTTNGSWKLIGNAVTIDFGDLKYEGTLYDGSRIIGHARRQGTPPRNWSFEVGKMTTWVAPPAQVWVNGYHRQDGTFVPGHFRSAADGNPANNWSTYPNVNPFTGKQGTHRP